MINESVLDVRTMQARERHPRILETFDSLDIGSAFVLVNDHDPKPLFYLFSVEKAEQFSWEYLEQGPETWRVRIARTADEPVKGEGGCCGCCGM